MGLFLKLLGLVDVLAAATLVLASTGIIPIRWTLTIAAALCLKAIVFWGGVVSAFDILLALYLAATTFTGAPLLNILFGLYLSIKGLYSFV